MDEILGLRGEFDEAELGADRERLNSLLADDFRSIGERGFVLDKEQWIARHDDFRLIGLETTEVEVRRYERTAIVRCAQRTQAIWRGTPMAVNARVGQVWVEQADGWRLAAIQFSTLAD